MLYRMRHQKLPYLPITRSQQDSTLTTQIPTLDITPSFELPTIIPVPRNIHPQILTVPRLRSIEDIPPIFTLRTYSSSSDTESFNRESSPEPSAPPMEDPTPPIARRTRSHRIKTPLTEETYIDISDVPSTSFSNQYTPTLESELVTPLHCPSDDLGDSFLANLLPFNSTSCPNTNGSDIENVLVGTDQHITLNMNDSEEEGYGAEPEENPYLFRRSGQKTFSKNLAKETTYKVKFNDTWKGKKLRNLKKELENMFDDVLNKAKGNDNDLGRVIISHPELNDSIVVPLDKWSNINSQRVMEAVENVLNSEENLPLDTSMHVTIGNITVPRGSGRFPIIRLKGTSNSLALKKSILQDCRDFRAVSNIRSKYGIRVLSGFECEKIVLEEDGAEIEDDEVLEELSGQLFIALTTEEWMPKTKT
ncbi:Hypothetical predicted protein [Mytilus galloprovincialis]|uniref:Uncharacterized protein n=1 Tax=Mytilus galloprovincialis TaxID=29158 RepID=A0A8B6FA27_MYTGA|nr:Hypothetical predicted protein [Mytilus galloprovincialis]